MKLSYFPPLPKKAQPPSKSKNNFDHYSKKFIPLECKTYIKYLGVLIANNLTWKQHSNYINEKKNSLKNGIIARLRHFAQLNTLQTIYKALFYLLFVIWYNRLETGGQDSC